MKQDLKQLEEQYKFIEKQEIETWKDLSHLKEKISNKVYFLIKKQWNIAS
jgi:hypothetical protein